MAHDARADDSGDGTQPTTLDLHDERSDDRHADEPPTSDADDQSSTVPGHSQQPDRDQQQANVESQHLTRHCNHADESDEDGESDDDSDTSSYSDATELPTQLHDMAPDRDENEELAAPPSDSFEQHPDPSAPHAVDTTQRTSEQHSVDVRALHAISPTLMMIDEDGQVEGMLSGTGDREHEYELLPDDQERCNEQIHSESSLSSQADDQAEAMDIDNDHELPAAQREASSPQQQERTIPAQLHYEPVVEQHQRPPVRQVHFAEPVSDGSPPHTAPSDDTLDLLRVIEYKVRQKERNLNSAFAQERAHLIAELDACDEASRNLQRNVEKLQGDFQTLQTAKQSADVVHENEKRGSEKFIQGLRNDVRSRETQLKELGKTLEVVEGEKLACEKKAEELNGELQAVKASHEDLVAKLKTAEEQLTEQLEKVKSLEDRLLDLESAERKSLAQGVADLQVTVQAHLKSVGKAEDSIARGIEKMQHGLRGLDARAVASPGDCAAIIQKAEELNMKAIASIGGLAESVNARNDDGTVGRINTIVTNATDRLHQDLISLNGALQQCETNDKQGHAELVERLQASLDRAVELEKQLAAAKSAQDALNEAALVSKSPVVSDSQQHTAPEATDTAPTREEIEREIAQAREEAQEAERARMAESAESFRIEKQADYDNKIRGTLADHDAAVQKLREKSEEITTLHRDIDKLQSELATVPGLRKDLNTATEKLQRLGLELQTAHGAAMEKIAIESRNKSLVGEVEGFRGELAKLKEAEAQLTQELEGCKKLTADALSEVENVRGQLTKLKGDNAQLTRDLEASEQAKAEAMSSENDARSRADEAISSVNDTNSRLESAIASGSAATTRNEAILAEHAALHKEWQRQLSETKDKLAQSEAGSARMQESCAKTVSEEREQYRKDKEALQSRLADAEKEVDNTAEEMQTFKQAMQHNWVRQEKAWKDDYDKVRRDLTDAVAAETAATHALEASERAVAERATRMCDAATNTDPQTQIIAPLPAICAPAVGAYRNDITLQQSSDHAPIASQQMNGTPDVSKGPVTMPPKQRCKVDRAAYATGPIPAPEVIRPKSSEAPPPAKTLGPVVEESQFGQYAASYPKDSQLHTHPGTSHTSNSDEMLDSATAPTLPESVPETQLDEALPTFTAFQGGFPPFNTVQSAGMSLHSPHFVPTKQPLVVNPRHLTVQHPTSSANDRSGFHIYEDQQENTQVASQVSEFTSTDYTFRKPMPKPNSASKRTASYGSTQGNPRTALQSVSVSVADRFKTPEPTNARNRTRAHDRMAVNDNAEHKSSSPPFVHELANVSKKQYHNALASAKQTRRISGEDTPRDPRLAGRPTAGKRSAPPDTQIERPSTAKRRQTIGNVTTRSQGLASGVGLMSGSSQSVNDLPRISDPHRRASGTGGPGTRMQKMAGGSTRSNASSKKTSKSSQYGDRFSQELGRR